VTALPEPQRTGVTRFRARLRVAMMLVVSAATALSLFFAQRHVAASERRDLQQAFTDALASLHAVQDVRHAALAERCRALARKPRIHAALEDNAPDLLYPSSADELSGIMDREDAAAREPEAYALHARFYRFLDAGGAVIPPPDPERVGRLTPAEEARLALRAVPDRPQSGYLARDRAGGDEPIDEVIAMPIVSTETGEVIAALVLGFKPLALAGPPAAVALRSGIWLDGRLHLPALAADARAGLAARIGRALAPPGPEATSFAVEVDGTPCLLFSKRLNPGSWFPPAHEVCIYPLTAAIARQRRLVWQFTGAGALLLLGALAASQFLSTRLSAPVEQLAVDSKEDRAQRHRAEAALELTSGELQRSARFSADASHQLKTPVTVLRAGLEELLASEKLPPETREEISALVHQTFRLTSVIEDLLLLSRMDAGRLQIEFHPVNLTPLVEAWLDDWGALPDGLDLAVETDIPPALVVAGENRYITIILQNLLENARKYSRPGGRVRIAAREEDGWGILTVANTGRPIPPAAREHIFERFHRGPVGENVPGHGLGLNLARELARLHRGDLRLARSDEVWTEFEVRFRLAGAATAVPPEAP
jgi:signal transduction histidine kinase